MSGKIFDLPELNNEPDAPPEVVEKAAKVEIIAMDIDGVLTDGHTWQLDNGEQLLCFSVQDGVALNLCRYVGVKLVVLSGRNLPAARIRMERFPIDEMRLSCIDKAAAMKEISAKHGVAMARISFIGDDMIDLPLMKLVGLPVAVPNAIPEVLAAAVWVPVRPGGEGAVRELITLVLKARRLYVQAVQNYLGDH
ncbi:MAG: HAD hydrolase family protein [Candidatus Glassbacteria bacterium]|nr:HAD hydrolase family protein [Candidatus Glassbacteria bacterium]